mgnify:CR=1 FL=1
MTQKDTQRLVAILALNTIMIVVSAEKLRWLQIILALLIVVLAATWVRDVRKEKK